MLSTYHLRMLYDLVPSARFRSLVFKAARRLHIPHLLVRFDTNNVCNLRCSICPYSLAEFRQKPKVMDFDLFTKIGKEVFPLTRVLELSCSYEPFMTKNFTEYLYFAARFMHDRSIGLTTNFQLLTEEDIRAAAQCRLEFFVSIDGFCREMYESIRTGASFDLLIDNLKAVNDFKAASKSQWPRLRVNFTMMRRNVDELQQLPVFCRQYGFDTVFLRHLIIWPKMEKILPESLFFHQPLYNACVDNVIIPLKKSGIKVIHPPKYDAPTNSQADAKKFTKGSCALPWFSFQVNVDGSFKICRLGVFRDPNHSYWNIIDRNPILKQELTKVLQEKSDKCQHCVGIGATNINVNRKENYFLDSEREKLIRPEDNW